MPNLTAIWNQFTAGEVSPRLWSRDDTKLYRAGVETMLNFLSVRHGPAFRRPGTVITSSFPGTYGRVIDFDVNSNEPFQIVFLPASASGTYDGDGFVCNMNGVVYKSNLITNPAFADGLTSWFQAISGKGSIEWQDYNAVLKAGKSGADNVLLSQAITITDINDDHLIHVLIHGLNAGGSPLKINVGLHALDSSLGSWEVQEGEEVFNVTFNPDGNATVHLTFIVIGENQGPQWVIEDTLMTSSQFTSVVEFDHPYSEEDLVLLQATKVPDSDTMYLTTPNIFPHGITRTSLFNWVFGVLSFTNQPIAWPLGTPGNITGSSPVSSTFHQGRSWWGGTPGAPETFWSSRSWEYLNCDSDTPSAPVEDSDGMEFTLDRKGAIRWIEGVKNLVIGTEVGEFIVTADQGVITSSDIQVEQQSANGSAPVAPVAIGNQIVYVSADGRKLRDMSFKWTESAWVSRDLSFTAEHLTEGRHIIEVHWAQNPEQILWMVDSYRGIFSCVYDIGNNIIGWHRHDTQGDVVSSCVTSYHGKSFLWILVNRYIEGTPTLYLERFDNTVNMDSTFIEYHDISSPSDQIHAPHLAGMECQAVIDGYVHPNITLDEFGDATLDKPGTVNAVGLQYIGRLKTLPVELAMKAGTSTPWMKGWNRIFVRLLDSCMPKINGERPPSRAGGSIMGLRAENVTEDVEVMNLGWDHLGQIEIEADLPLPCNLSGIFGEVSAEKL